MDARVDGRGIRPRSGEPGVLLRLDWDVLAEVPHLSASDRRSPAWPPNPVVGEPPPAA